MKKVKTEEKRTEFRVKVTTYIQGEIKNMFISDCLQKGICEAKLARQILEQYYSNKITNNRNVY